MALRLSFLMAGIASVLINPGTAMAVTYSVNRSWNEGGNTASLVGTLDLPLGDYTIMNHAATPFTAINLTLTINETSFSVVSADTSVISGTGQFLIHATASMLTFDTANANGPNPADLAFRTGTTSVFYGIGSDQDPAFEVAYTATRSVLTHPTFPTLYGTSVGPPALVAAASRKNHGAAGNFDIPLPVSGGLGIECRSPGADGTDILVLTLNTTVFSAQASVTSGVGHVQGSPIISNNQITITLAGVANAQDLTITVTGNFGGQTGSVMLTFGVLEGDVNGNGVVNASDIGSVKSHSGQLTGANNFRSDVNVSGAINASDVGLVKSRLGTGVP